MKMLLYHRLQPLLLLLAALLTIQIFAASIKGDENLIIKTCNQTEAGLSDFCVRALESDPRSFTADLHGLARITIELCYANVSDTEKFIDVLLQNETDPAVEDSLKGCREVYDLGLSWMQEALDAFDRGDMHDVNPSVGGATTVALDCKDMFGQANLTPPQSLTLRNDMLYNLSGVSLTFTSLLG